MQEEKQVEVSKDVSVTVTNADGTVEQIKDAKVVVTGDDKKDFGMSKSKLLKMARRAELKRGHKVYPPGSSWKRRDGSRAQAGPRYGANVAPAKGSP